jgi:hypothetical protein
MKEKKLFILLSIFISAVLLTVLISGCKTTSDTVKTQQIESAEAGGYGELGRVRWSRSYDEAIAAASSNDKPLLVYIYDVSESEETARYGSEVLSHPLIVESIETLFSPLAVRNDGEGADAEILAMLGEQAGNGMVIRILETDGGDLSERIENGYSQEVLLYSMVRALEKSNRDAPLYVKILHEESVTWEETESAVFPVHCFWDGEVELGPTVGIVKTVPGKMKEKEAVEVVYDPKVTSYRELLELSHEAGLCAEAFVSTEEQREVAKEVFGAEKVSEVDEFTPDRFPKYYLYKSLYQHVPMTDRQAILVNSDLFFNKDPQVHLSPRQIQMYDFIKNYKNKIWKSQVHDENLTSNWVELTQKIEKTSKGKVVIY